MFDPEFLKLVQSLTVGGLLGVIAVAFWKGWIIPAYRYKEIQKEIESLKAECAEWKRMAMHGTRIATYAAELAEEAHNRINGDQDDPTRRD